MMPELPLHPADTRTARSPGARLRRLTPALRFAGAVGAATVVAVGMAGAASAAPSVVSTAGKVCTIVGTVGNDRLVGTGGHDVICALGGNDSVDAGPGNDTVDGGDGNDALVGGPGNDVLRGGAGNDQQVGGDGNDDLAGDEGSDRLDGEEGDDRLDGGRGDDHLEGGAGINTCMHDGEDSSQVDRCTDKEAPAIDVSSVKWVTSSTLDNAADRTILLQARVTDDRSGMMYVWVKFRSPDPAAPAVVVGFHAARFVNGRSGNGVYEMQGRLPALSAAGVWTAQELYVQDRVSRYTRYTATPDGRYTTQNTVDRTVQTGTVKLAPMVVSGVTDRQAPVANVAAAQWSGSTSIDNSVDRTVVVLLPVTDDLSGTTGVSIVLNTAGEALTMKLAASRLLSGTPTAGQWEVRGTLPAYTPAGTWNVTAVTTTDRVGNTRTVQPAGAGWLSALTVTGASDTQLPTVDMSFGEYVGATSADNTADRTVVLRVRAGDDLSGVANVWADYRTIGAQSRLDPRKVAGADGIWELVGTLPRTTTPGAWKVTGIYVTDRVGRQRVYYVQPNGSYTTNDGALSGVAAFPTFTLLGTAGK